MRSGILLALTLIVFGAVANTTARANDDLTISIKLQPSRFGTISTGGLEVDVQKFGEERGTPSVTDKNGQITVDGARGGGIYFVDVFDPLFEEFSDELEYGYSTYVYIPPGGKAEITITGKEMHPYPGYSGTILTRARRLGDRAALGIPGYADSYAEAYEVARHQIATEKRFLEDLEKAIDAFRQANDIKVRTAADARAALEAAVEHAQRLRIGQRP